MNYTVPAFKLFVDCTKLELACIAGAEMGCMWQLNAIVFALTRSPVAGWSSWNAFGCTDAMNETSIKKIADFMQ